MSTRLVTYTIPDGPSPTRHAVGLWVGDYVVDVIGAAQACGTVDCRCEAECRPSVATILAREDCLAAVCACGRWFETADATARSQVARPLSEVKLLAPVPRPPKLLALAGNYRAHIKESQGAGNIGRVVESDLATPRVFMKPVSNTVCGPHDPIFINPHNVFVDYEAEMAVIIGQGGRNISRADALKHVSGITICNDVSERDMHIWDRPETREWDKFFDWLNGKWCDNFAPMGPCAVPIGDIPDIHNLAMKLSVNGELRQDSNTAEMVFDVPMLIEYISHVCTLETGDIIATGTPSGVGKALGIALEPGDVVDIELEGVGILSNPVVAREA
jgi:2-keto-4-pentenoate hydratase/2-oxohepta-3-ene-1,7-dioic acid hydratase in catechol pathway